MFLHSIALVFSHKRLSSGQHAMGESRAGVGWVLATQSWGYNAKVSFYLSGSSFGGGGMVMRGV